MKMLLSEALGHAGDGSRSQGEVRIDGQTARLFRSKEEGSNRVVWAEGSLFADPTFVDQDVEFDLEGVAEVRDVHGRVRRMQIRVLMPLTKDLRMLRLLFPEDRDG